MRKPELAEVYRDHVNDVYAFFAYRFGTRTEAEDLTQLTFERALKAWRRFDPQRASPKTWLLAIASNLAIDHMRADRSSQHVSDGQLAESPAAESANRNFGPDPRLAAALAQLTERERVVLALRFGGDLKAGEIAELLDLSLANVQQLQSRALRRLRSLLGSEIEAS